MVQSARREKADVLEKVQPDPEGDKLSNILENDIDVQVGLKQAVASRATGAGCGNFASPVLRRGAAE